MSEINCFTKGKSGSMKINEPKLESKKRIHTSRAFFFTLNKTCREDL